MRFVGFLFSAIITVALVYLLNSSFKAGETDVPAVGKLLNPFSGVWQNANKANDTIPSNILLPGLKAPAKVIYDDRLIPHLFTENDIDAAYLQGYVSAQHRLWQMDFSTRAASGRLSEIVGSRTLNYDKETRRLGMVFAAENAIKGWKSDAKMFAFLEAYAEGVNQYISQLEPKDYPLEFKLMSYEPELWTPLKSALFIKSMARNLCARENDLENTNAMQYFGKEAFDKLFPEYFPDQSPIIPKGTPWNFTPVHPKEGIKIQQPIGAVEHKAFEKPHPSNGSNNWAIHGSKTKSGNPILCGDPHLGMTLPAIWMEMQIHTPNYNCYGVALPGLPGIIIGFNEHIAWTPTNVGHDVMDLYTIKWQDDRKTHYMLDGKAVKAEFKYESYLVKGQETVIDTVRYTKWGPVAYDNKKNSPDLAVRWISHDTQAQSEISTFYLMNKAKNYDDYVAALKDYVAPAQNFAFASKDGDIAIRVEGKLPIKRDQQGRFIQDGSLSANGWLGFIPKSQVPAIKNPARGFVSSANQHSTDKDYPYYYNSAGFEDYRGRYLNRKLAEMSDVTVDDMTALQNSNYSLKAASMLPLFLSFLEEDQLDEDGKKYLTKLKLWDYNYDREQLAPVLYQIWNRKFYNFTWDEFKNDSLDMVRPDSWIATNLMNDDPENIYFDVLASKGKETAKDIVNKSFQEMVKEANKWVAKTKQADRGTYAPTRIKHLARIEGLGRKLYASGIGDALNATYSSHGPSWRMVVELGDEMKAKVVYPGGTSGNPASPHYDDFMDEWENGQYFEALFMKSAEEKSTRIKAIQNVNAQ